MELNHRLYLYKPSGLPEDFLGELVVDNLQVDIKLQDISTVSFRIPKTINGEFNPRINQVLDSYVVELWYGRVQKIGAVDGLDYQKIRFRIYSTPLEFQEEKFLHSYAGYSIESDLEFKQIISWPGIKVQDFFRSVVYGNNTQSTVTGNIRTITQQGTFSETGITPAYTISTNTSGVRYITIPTTTLTASDLDIFIYENRRDVATDAESESSLIPFENVNGVESNLFKAGYYILNKNLDNVVSVSIALPDNLFDFDAFTTSQKIFTYSLYDNPISRRISIGINTDNIQPLSDMYINLAQDAAEGQPLVFGIAGGPNYTFTSQEIYTKNGLSLYQILLGHDMDLGVTYQSVFYPKGVIYNDILYSDGIVPEGILFNSGFYLGTITETIAEKFRSNIEFNNITIYQAVKDIAESFESIAVFDTINKTVSFYAENEYGINNGLILKYGTYLKSVNKEIDSSKIVTSARALGKNNLKITLISPTGKEVWEDYSYFLDDFHIDFETKKTSVLSPLNPNINIAASNVRGIAAIYESDTGYQSRWLDIDVARTLASWQFARDYFHELMSGNLEDEEILFSSEYDHQRYNGLYDIRNRAIELYVKYETEYENKKASEYKYAYLRDYYQEKYGGNNSTAEDLNKLNYYIGKYNESVEQTIDFKEEFLDPLYADIYDATIEDSIAQKFSEVLSFLEKRKHFLIDNQPVTQEYFDNFIYPKIRPFVREYVHNDSKIDTEYDLLKSTKIYVDENKEPKVTININVADILAAYEAYNDWDKFKIGDKIYLYFPEFNIDLEAQIREFSVNFDSKTLSLVISTVRNYNRGFGRFILRNIKTLSNVNKNTVQFYQDDTVSNTNQRQEVANILNNGINTTTTPVNTGASDTNGNSSTTTGGEGIVSNNIETVDPVTETLTFGSRQKGVRISDGRVLSYKPYVDGENLLFTQEIEVSAENGFVIRKVLNDANKTVQKQVYIDTNGNAVFAGTLEVGSDAYNQVVSLAGAGTTVFKAGSMSELNAIVIANVNDLLLVSATFTDTTPEPDRVYIKDDIYRYDLVQTDPTNVYDWVLAADLKTKITGSVAGWTINGTDIASNNQKITLHSDSDDSGNNPYVSIAQSSKGYNNTGIFLGFDSLVGKLSIVSNDNSLKWTGTKLSIKGDLEIGTTDAFYTTGKTSFTNSTAGIFIGYDNSGIPSYKLNIGDATKSLKWNGLDLTLTGNLSGSTGRFGSLTSTDYAVYLGDTTTPFEVRQDSTGNQIVYVKSSGDAKFGKLEILGDTNIFTGNISVGSTEIKPNGVSGYKFLIANRSDISFLAPNKIQSDTTDFTTFNIAVGDLIKVSAFLRNGATSANNNQIFTVEEIYSDEIIVEESTVITEAINTGNKFITLEGKRNYELNNQGVLTAVNIRLENDESNQLIEIGNLSNSPAGDYGLEVTNQSGYYTDLNEVSFSAADNSINHTYDQSVLDFATVYIPGNIIIIAGAVNNANNGPHIIDSIPAYNKLIISNDSTLVTASVGPDISISRNNPYKVSVTESGFFISTVNATDQEDIALGIDYNSNVIWGKRLVISDLAPTLDSNVGGTLVGSWLERDENDNVFTTYGTRVVQSYTDTEDGNATKYNTIRMTGRGFSIRQAGSAANLGNETFKVETDGTISAKTLRISGASKLANWNVNNNAIYFGSTPVTDGVSYDNDGITLGVMNDGGPLKPFISTKQFLVDKDGNAFFKGTLSAGIDTAAIDGNYDPSGSAATAKTEAISEANNYTDDEITSAVEDLEEQISAVQDQIDGAISTYFAGGTPLPIITDYTGGTTPSNPQEGETWYNGSIYQIFTQGAWVAGGNDDIDTQTPWPTNDSEAIAQEYLSLLDFYTRRVGDLYYDNDTGYAYRFTKTGVVTPDVSTNYTWTQISDTAATAALAAASTAQETADGKSTVFYALDSGEFATASSAAEEGDLLIITGTPFTVSSVTYYTNDSYKRVGGNWTKVQNIENKNSGKVAGWSIDSENIYALNNTIKLHSNSVTNSGLAPFIAINKSSYTDNTTNGMFMGLVSDGGQYPFKMSIGTLTDYLNWNGTNLSVSGTINANAGNFTSTVTIGSNSPATDGILQVGANSTTNITIKGTTASANTSIYSGSTTFTTGSGFYMNADGKFKVGDSSGQYMSWDNTNGLLSVVGDIGGNIGQIAVGSRVLINQSGIFGLSANGESAPNVNNNFQLLANSGSLVAKNATIQGNITASTGNIGGFTIENTVLTAGSLSAGPSGSNVGLTPESGASGISIWAGALIASGTVPTNAEVAVAPFRVTKSGALTSTLGNIGGFTISSTALHTGTKSTFASNNAGVYIASDGIALGTNSPFKVTSSGVMTASSGTIASWSIDQRDLISTYNPTIVSSTTSVTIGTGSKTFTFASTTTNWKIGDFIFARFSASRRMYGNITNITNTSVTINVTRAFFGGETYSSWVLGFLFNYDTYLKPTEIQIKASGVSPYFTSSPFVRAGVVQLSTGSYAPILELSDSSPGNFDTALGTSGTNSIRIKPDSISFYGGAEVNPNFAIRNYGPGELAVGSFGDLILGAGYKVGAEAGTPSTGTRIYLQNGGISGYGLQPLRNPNGLGGFDGATEVSSKIVKENFEIIKTEEIETLLNTIEMRKFNYKENKYFTGYSFIIEDELEKNTPLIKDIVYSIEGTKLYNTFEEVPEYLKPYLNTNYLKQREDGKYEYSSLEYRSSALAGITLAATQLNHNRIKELEEENKKLKEEISLIKARLGI
jgi:hypothetical protein